VVLESLASGTPVFGFATGGIPEMVENAHNGYLVKNNNTEELASKINSLSSKLGELSLNAKKSIIGKFDRQTFLRKHIKLYEGR
jgi:glycosyltransferase involved in cell wall biosynthesis